MALIELTGKYAVGGHRFAIVDDDMVETLNKFKWKAKPNGSGKLVYAARNSIVDGKCVLVRMHRVVLGLMAGDGRDVDHINHHTLDNRRANLRAVTRSENLRHRRVRDYTMPSKVCGASVTRALRGPPTCGTTCDQCQRAKAKEKARAKASPIYFPACLGCRAIFTARKAGHAFCSERCRWKAKRSGLHARPMQ